VKTKLKWNFLNCAAAFLGTFFLGPAALAQTSVVWTGDGNDGQWSNPTNWTPEDVPNGAFDVTIVDGRATLSSDVALQTLTLSTYAAVNGNFNITVDGLLTFEAAIGDGAGTIAGAGVLTPAGGVLISNGPVDLDFGRTVNNSGTMAVVGDAAGVSLAGGENPGDGGTIVNLPTGVLDFQGNGEATGGNIGLITNAGLFEKTSGTNVSIISVAFTNTGTVSVQSGTLNFTGATDSSSGLFDVSAGAVCAFTGPSGGFYFTPGATLSGSGVYNVGEEGSVIFSTDLSVSNLMLQNGVILNSNRLTVAQSLDFATSATLTGPGTIIMLPGSIMTFTNGGNRSITQQTINNSGTLLWGDGDNVTLDGGAVFNNLTNGVFDVTNNGAMAFDTNSTFINYGLFEQPSGSGMTAIGVFTNYGTVRLQSGTVSFGYGYNQMAGTTSLAGGNLSGAPNVSIFGGALQGQGTIIGGDAQPGVFNGGTFTLTGLLKILSASFGQASGATLNIALGGTNVGNGYGQLNIAGGATLDGTLNITLTNGFRPQPGDSFQVLTCNYAVNGSFATINGLNLGAGLTLQPVYTATNLTLIAVEVPPQLAPSGPYSHGTFQLQLTGASGQNVLIQASTNLLNWDAVSTNTLTSNPLDVIDTNAHNFSWRFYRALVLP
jgi:hypothetical protein